MFVIIELIIASFLLLFSNKNKNIYHSEQVELTPKIKVPKPVGQGQYGTGWWLNKKDYNKVFKCNLIDRTKPYNEVAFDSGGIVTHFERDGNIDMFISDVKGELYLYTAEKLKQLGYDVIALDYISFLKSNWYNYLDIVINAVEDDNFINEKAAGSPIENVKFEIYIQIII